jgi:pimeloyl-ACP methyl ester carboxylesterase
MATFVLIHGGGDVGWCWHRVEAELRRRGHDSVAPDLPCDDESAGLSEYANAVVAAVGDRRHLVVVGHSYGGFTAPLVADRVPVDLLGLVAGMDPGSRGDVPRALAEEAMSKEREESDTAYHFRWPLAAWPAVPTRFVLCTEDRLFPPDFLRRLVTERLGITPDEIAAGTAWH